MEQEHRTQYGSLDQPDAFMSADKSMLWKMETQWKRQSMSWP